MVSVYCASVPVQQGMYEYSRTAILNELLEGPGRIERDHGIKNMRSF